MGQRAESENDKRVSHVEQVVRHYSRVPGYSGSEPDYEADIVDFLTDLQHFCTGVGLDFDEVNETAKRHYEHEVKDLARCDDCRRVWATGDLVRINDFWDRVNAGEIMPSGQCPSCGALCHLGVPEEHLDQDIGRTAEKEEEDNG